MRRNLIAALDVGTTKMCALVGEEVDNRVDILATGMAPSNGLRKGVVINIESAVDSIKKAVKEAETISGVEIKSVYVGIAGGHIKGFDSYGAVGIKGREVRPRDVERAIDSARVVYIPLDREVLHIIPTEFILDGQCGIKDPVGMSGIRLEVKVNIITGALSSVQNLLKCCERAGLDVLGVVLEPIASAEAVLTEDEKELGVALIDIGGGTTDIAVYMDGNLRHTSIIAIGGSHFTNDIVIGLRLPVQEAERVKKNYGCAVVNLVDGAEEIDVAGADRQVRKIPMKYVSEIIQPRCEELAELINKEIGNISCLSGIVLTGGASLLSGIDRIIEAGLGLPVRIGVPEGIKSSFSPMQDTIASPIYSTGVGLILHAANETDTILGGDMLNVAFGRIKGWARTLFGIESPERLSARQRV